MERKTCSCDHCEYTTMKAATGNLDMNQTARGPCEQCHFLAATVDGLNVHMEFFKSYQAQREKSWNEKFSCDHCEYTAKKAAEFSEHWKSRLEPNSTWTM